MKDYWLAKLISSVQEVDSRKRLQKSVYLLQAAGCPLQCDYLLHYYGPYSFELAGLIDQLHAADIIDETPDQLAAGVVRFRSATTEKGARALNAFEQTERGQQTQAQIAPFIDRFKKLNQEDAWVLELAATVAFYHDDDWQVARAQTATFKKINEDDLNLSKAVGLAKAFLSTR